MTRVRARCNEVEIEGDYATMDGVELTCTRCGHSEESAGTGEQSIARCAVLLRKHCPLGEENYYYVR